MTKKYKGLDKIVENVPWERSMYLDDVVGIDEDVTDVEKGKIGIPQANHTPWFTEYTFNVLYAAICNPYRVMDVLESEYSMIYNDSALSDFEDSDIRDLGYEEYRNKATGWNGYAVRYNFLAEVCRVVVLIEQVEYKDWKRDFMQSFRKFLQNNEGKFRVQTAKFTGRDVSFYHEGSPTRFRAKNRDEEPEVKDVLTV